VLEQIMRIEATIGAIAPTDKARGTALARRRIDTAKRAFTTRRVDLTQRLRLLDHGIPRAGDLILARIETLGQHLRLETPHGRRAALYEGDEIVVAYGDRYAPDQFEAEVPATLEPCDLVAGGGVAGKVLSRHARMRRATRIEPIGFLADSAGRRLNLAQFALPVREVAADRPRIIVVVGSSMNAGKTTTAAGLIHGLSRAGLIVASAKVTGTGSGGDMWSMIDAGSRRSLDFTDMGHASTAGLSPAQVERTALSLIAHVAADHPDVIVVEIADGVLQTETASLLRSRVFRGLIDGAIFAAADALGAFAGREWLLREGLPVLGVSGLVSASPLASREAEAAMGCDVLTLEQLRDPAFAPKLCFAADPAELVAKVRA
jgi:hypothetical protein